MDTGSWVAIGTVVGSVLGGLGGWILKWANDRAKERTDDHIMIIGEFERLIATLHASLEKERLHVSAQQMDERKSHSEMMNQLQIGFDRRAQAISEVLLKNSEALLENTKAVQNNQYSILGIISHIEAKDMRRGENRKDDNSYPSASD